MNSECLTEKQRTKMHNQTITPCMQHSNK